jgi:hypothetical protein
MEQFSSKSKNVLKKIIFVFVEDMDRYGRLEFWGTQYIIQIAEMAFCNFILLLSSQIVFRMLKKVNAFWMILKH